ncbi:MAG: lipoate protein ligase C-terminal domain-containing protein [Candidatus Micrarchaeota archaeon]
MRLAVGTAIVLGLGRGKLQSAPTTAHFLIGDNCRHSCAYCNVNNSMIARIGWPEFPEDEVFGSSFSCFKRACLQLTSTGLEKALEAIPRIPLPVSVSLRTDNKGDVRKLFSAGADRVCIPLDSCTPEISENVGRGDFEAKVEVLKWASQEFPGKIATHLIIGLGESEKQSIELMKELYASGVYVGLFAFTPVKGSSLESHARPSLGSYRRIQIARYLISKGTTDFTYNSRKELIDFPDVGGEAFLTSGCPGCNRPYFDGSPSKLYNYPRPLNEGERAMANQQARIYRGKNIHKAGKLIKIDLEYSDRIEKISIRGDFFAYPEEGIEGIEQALVGSTLTKKDIKTRIENSLKDIDVFGFDSDSLTTAIVGAFDEDKAA